MASLCCNKLGKGSLGQVILVKQKTTGVKYAMKAIRKPLAIDDDMRDQIIDKRHLLLRLNHPFIASLQFSFQSKANLFFVFDYLEGGTLKSLIQKEGKLSEERAKFILAELILGLEYLHQNDVVCADLTSQNILFDSNKNIKLTDFSSTRLLFKQDESDYITSSIQYMAPESVKDDNPTYCSDWWTLGIIFYEMIFGDLPYSSSELSAVLKQITNDEIVIPSSSCSDEARDLMGKLLQKDPQERLGNVDSSYIMGHSFFKDVNWYKVMKRQTKTDYLSPPSEGSDIYKSTGPSNPETILISEEVKYSQASKFQNLKLTVEGFSYDGDSALACSDCSSSPKKSSLASEN
ncbi:unnamed protein product [Moneuplotes crassus]|uniref:Protein kinase domain-containing protein n=1 Tax=Euplotes crassus TaxID=5936 RepID=A0AAD1UPK8_EUPCR|nr:unnamed protein product [Moneuplotes crassus]